MAENVASWSLKEENHKNGTRDPRTKTGWSRTRTGKILEMLDQVGPVPRKLYKSRTRSDQYRENFRNVGPGRTSTEKILEIPDQLGPGPRKF